MKKNIAAIAILVCVLAVGGGAAFYFSNSTGSNSSPDAGQSSIAPEDLTPEANAPQPNPDDIFLGDANAPVTIIEYFSLSCPHCARFHKEVLPQLKKDYIDTGKVKLIFRDFPLNRPALAAALLARCQSPVKYPAMIEYLFETADQWLIEQPLPPLEQIAKTAGMDEASFKQCVENNELREKIVASRADASTKYGINSTPTFYINGVKISGTQAYDKYRAIIDALLVKAN
jgi:protein-disulfide isomerase